MAATGHGATFSFVGNRFGESVSITGGLTRLTVETPKAEVTDITSVTDPPGYCVLMPTGQWKDGSINIEYAASASMPDVQLFVGAVGRLTFESPGFSVSRNVVVDSGSSAVTVNDVVRGSVRFLMTDYFPQ